MSLPHTVPLPPPIAEQTPARVWGPEGVFRGHFLPVASVVFLVGGIAAWVWLPARLLANDVWTAGLVITGAPVVWRTLRSALRRQFSTDITATLAIVAAVAIGQPLPGLIVVLMQTGGEALEKIARGRASDALRKLEEDAPRIAHLLHAGGLSDVPVGEARVGDVVVIRPGELVPLDAIVVSGRSHVDASRLTGEPMPVSAVTGTTLASGSVNHEGALTARVIAPVGESQYGRIVELVRHAQATKAPLQRLADRYAIWFTPLTLAVCLAAYVATRDPVIVLAILVVATPCPLILATPVAIIGGINTAAKRQIVVRDGGALERLARVNVAVFDKTGTLTPGVPEVSAVVTSCGWDEGDLLRLAGALEERSGHLLARSLVKAALAKGVLLPPASHVTETAGRGVTGTVDGRVVTVGSRSYVLELHPGASDGYADLDEQSSALRAYVAVDGLGVGRVEYDDRVRPGVRQVLADLAAQGIRRTLLLSGDDERHTRRIADSAGIANAVGELKPEGKVRAIEQMIGDGDQVLMVGDGTNDAPALSTATVGIAMAAHGGGISAEAADVVILVDDLGRVSEAVQISHRTIRIAKQSIWTGLGLSGVAMGFAAFGYIPPVIGAVLQEFIDVAVIVNALRVSR
ncbi:MAG: heavy metal translocating P-type ATPase [Gemmatimonadaceae bacterium]